MLDIPSVERPAASVIVRAKNEDRTIERTLALLRQQTVQPEIVVVDSGSTDRTLSIARRYCDQLLELRPEEFSYGRALNLGARAAGAPIHFALSAHCPVESADWLARSLAHYERVDVAATSGAHADPSGRPLRRVFYQDAAHARAHPYWGFSNHASSWRAAVWTEFPFDEELNTAEDREWALRVLDAGWVIAFDPATWVPLTHRWRTSVRGIYRRNFKEAQAVASFANGPPYRLRDCAREWWSGVPDDRHTPLLYRLDYRRIVALAGKYRGERAARGR
jgi:glycosyltransferase involved in cell wall biosynthesis